MGDEEPRLADSAFVLLHSVAVDDRAQTLIGDLHGVEAALAALAGQLHATIDFAADVIEKEGLLAGEASVLFIVQAARFPRLTLVGDLAQEVLGRAL